MDKQTHKEENKYANKQIKDHLWGGTCVDRIHSEPTSNSNAGEDKCTTTNWGGE